MGFLIYLIDFLRSVAIFVHDRRRVGICLVFNEMSGSQELWSIDSSASSVGHRSN